MARDVGLSRRQILSRGLAAGAAVGLAACDRLSQASDSRSALEAAESLTKAVQRALIGPREALAPEYSEADISKVFKANGSTEPDDPDYQRFREEGFASWRLVVDGLVEKPQRLSLADLRALPSRTQITRHDCVEGWSCIGKWTGAPLKEVLDLAGLKPGARYIVFHCADTLEQTLDGTGQYYESIDLVDAFHPQTILAYDMSGAPLPVAHGAPLRLRVERQLGYKMAKYVMRVEAANDFSSLGRGRGGFWEDRGYEWYAGI
ncbi:MAG TPA: molybdopterin-binding protein [Roseiarcus sp.]|nr:molybdopterin-binding protein [Roseiarcus sp.]